MNIFRRLPVSLSAFAASVPFVLGLLATSAIASADPTAVFHSTPASSLTSTRVLTKEGAAALLASTEGSAWRVLLITSPACGVEKGKACKAIQQECKESQKYAEKHSALFACSNLYQSTSVLLSSGHMPAASKPDE